MRAAVVDALRGALAGRKEIALALLFGSFARDRARADSDADVAVLGRDLDLLALIADLSDAVKRQVDVVDLAQAGYPLTKALLRDAIVLHQGVPGAAAAWRTRAILEVETDRPWFERMRDAYLKHLAARAEVYASVVAAKLPELDDRMARVRAHLPADAAALAANRDALELVSFNLMLAVQACLDIASHLIADEGWPAASSLGEAFQSLGEHGVVTPTTAAALRRAAGLRNVVAHGYAVANPELLFAAASGGVADLRRFASEVSAWVASRS